MPPDTAADQSGNVCLLSFPFTINSVLLPSSSTSLSTDFSGLAIGIA